MLHSKQNTDQQQLQPVSFWDLRYKIITSVVFIAQNNKTDTIHLFRSRNAVLDLYIIKTNEYYRQRKGNYSFLFTQKNKIS